MYFIIQWWYNEHVVLETDQHVCVAVIAWDVALSMVIIYYIPSIPFITRWRKHNILFHSLSLLLILILHIICYTVNLSIYIYIYTYIYLSLYIYLSVCPTECLQSIIRGCIRRQWFQKKPERQKWEANGMKTSIIILFPQPWWWYTGGTCSWVNLQGHIFELSIRVELNREGKYKTLKSIEEKSNTWYR